MPIHSKNPRALKRFCLSETDRGHQLHSGEIVFFEFWHLMQVSLDAELPHLLRGDIYTAKDLVNPALWALLYQNERFRMGRCLYSYSCDPGSRIKLVPYSGKSLYPRRYRLN